MYNTVNEPILVGAIFSAGRVVPRFFVWKNRKYRVDEVTYFWRSGKGSYPIFHFAVKSYNSIYEISYNLKTSNWYVEKAYVD